MVTISKFKENLIDFEFYKTWKLTPHEVQLKEDLKKMGHGVYLINIDYHTQTWYWFGIDFIIVDNIQSTRERNLYVEFLKKVYYGEK